MKLIFGSNKSSLKALLGGGISVVIISRKAPTATPLQQTKQPFLGRSFMIFSWARGEDSLRFISFIGGGRGGIRASVDARFPGGKGYLAKRGLSRKTTNISCRLGCPTAYVFGCNVSGRAEKYSRIFFRGAENFLSLNRRAKGVHEIQSGDPNRRRGAMAD